VKVDFFHITIFDINVIVNFISQNSDEISLLNFSREISQNFVELFFVEKYMNILIKTTD
jgi:hypothetical protein